MNPTSIVAARANNDVVQAVIIHIAAGSHGESKVVAECFRGDDRTGVRRIDISGKWTVEEISTPGKTGDRVVGRRTHDQVRDAIAVNIACWRDAPPEIVVAAFPCNRDIGRRRRLRFQVWVDQAER